MKKFLLIMLFFSIHLFSATDNPVKYSFLPGEIVVKTRTRDLDLTQLTLLNSVLERTRSNGGIEALFQLDRLKKPFRAESIGLDRIFLVKIQDGIDLPELCLQLQQLPEIEWAEPIYIIPEHLEPNDTYYSQQYHLPQIEMPSAWEVSRGDSGVVIGIIDSGVDWLHPDLVDKIWVNPGEDVDGDGLITAADSNGVDDDGNGFVDDFIGWDWVTGVSGSGDTDAAPEEDGEDEDNNPMDVNGHGTHVAGLAAAATNNNLGVASVSWSCRIMPLRIGWKANDGNGYGLSIWMSQAFVYAADNGAKVTNLSYGNSQVVLEGASYAFANDVCIATSAGNSDDIITDPLSVVPWSMTVTAVDQNDVKTWYSSFGEAATVAAPGGAVTQDDPGLLSTYPNGGYVRMGGTSMASPVTAGLLALVRSYYPQWSAARTYYQVEATADNIDDLNPDYAGLLGSGRINAYRALTENIIPRPKLSLGWVEFNESNGNNNQIIEPGEEVAIIVHLKNDWAGTSNVTANLLTLPDEDRITLLNSSVQFDTIYGLEDFGVDNNNQDSPFTLQVNANLPPCEIPLFLELNYSGGGVDTFQFHLSIYPQVLFVDDHLGGGDGNDLPIFDYYKTSLQALNIAFDYWLNYTAPDSTLLARYPIVIWGCEWAFPSLNEEDRAVLGNYLENGGRLFLSGQDIGWDMCDPGSNSNEYALSGGASRDWYEQYLSAQYLSDAGGVSPLLPVDSTFLQGLKPMEFAQPGRDQYNYPSTITPVNNGYSILEYRNGEIAAVAADEPYQTVYFAFGGFEAISDSIQRTLTLKRILNHLAEIKAEPKLWSNTEFTGPFDIPVKIFSDKNLITKQLWYRYNDGSWESLELTPLSDTLYTVQIPAIPDDSAYVEYYLFIRAEDGTYFANERHRFYSGPDHLPPYAMDVLPPEDDVDQMGPYGFKARLFDNIAIDTNNVRLHFFTTEMPVDSILLEYTGDHWWQGNFQFSEPLADGDTVFMYLSFSDQASGNPNHARYPEEGYLSFTIKPQLLLDDFEQDLSKWRNDENNLWSQYRDPSFVQYGVSCLISSDGLTYPANVNASIEFNKKINLSTREKATLRFLEAHFLEDEGDTCFLEIKSGEGEWQPVMKFFGSGFQNWEERTVNLYQYCGSGQAPIALRFRFQSDGNYVGRPGVLIDRIEILTDETAGISAESGTIPLSFQVKEPFPNPFNSTLHLKFNLPAPGKVKLSIVDLNGRIIYHTSFRKNKPGNYNFEWQGYSNTGQALPSGLYLIRIQYENQTQIRKILLLK